MLPKTGEQTRVSRGHGIPFHSLPFVDRTGGLAIGESRLLPGSLSAGSGAACPSSSFYRRMACRLIGGRRTQRRFQSALEYTGIVVERCLCFDVPAIRFPPGLIARIGGRVILPHPRSFGGLAVGAAVLGRYHTESAGLYRERRQYKESAITAAVG